MTCKLSGVVSPCFSKVHREIKAGNVKELVAKGGRGSTKSSYISIELILQLLKHPQCHAAVFRKVGNTLRTSVYAQIVWAINELGLHDHFRCTVSPMECTYLPTGQKVLFFGVDDPGKELHKSVGAAALASAKSHLDGGRCRRCKSLAIRDIMTARRGLRATAWGCCGMLCAAP